MNFVRMRQGVSGQFVLLLFGAIGGALTSLTVMPLPWLIGALLASAVARLTMTLSAPWKVGRNVGQLVLAATVALAFTPEVLGMMVGLLPFMVMAAIASIAIACAIAILLTRMSKIDSATAYYSCMPGGMAEMSNLADRRGGSGPLVAIAQSIRIILVVIIIPVAMYATAGELPVTAASSPGNQGSLSFFVVILVLAAGCMGSLVFAKVGMINSWFLGALVVIGALAATEIVAGEMPYGVSATGQVLLGTVLGARLDATQLQAARKSVPLFVFGTMALIAANAAFAFLLVFFLPLDIWTLLLGNAPGGIAEMSITADVLGASVAVVTAFHISRVLIIVGFSDAIYARIFRRVVRRENM